MSVATELKENLLFGLGEEMVIFLKLGPELFREQRAYTQNKNQIISASRYKYLTTRQHERGLMDRADNLNGRGGARLHTSYITAGPNDYHVTDGWEDAFDT